MPGSDAVSPARAERPLVLAVDVGSSSVRAALHDGLGRTLRGTEVQVGYAWQTGSGGSVRLPFPAFEELVGRALTEIEVVAGPLLGDVAAAGITSFIHSIVGLDGSGRPVTPVLSWADTTGADDAARLREGIDAASAHAMTGAPIHAGYWPARIARLRREQPGIRRWAGLPDLLGSSLTGRATVSRSMASGTGLLDRAAGTWADGLLEQLQVDRRELPEIANDDEMLGALRGPARRRWSGLSGFGWYGAWGDGGCSNVGLGAVGTQAAALTVGTSGALRSVVPDPAVALSGGLFAQRLGKWSIVGGQLSEGGGTLAWAHGLLSRPQAALEQAAAKLAPDEHGLTVLPYVFGERGPGYHHDARGAVIGLSADTDAAALYRATIESIAFSFAAVDEELTQALGAAPSVVASGGALASSPLLRQVLADSLGRDLRVAPTVESSRRGAALLALWGSGKLADPFAVPGPATRVVRSEPLAAARYRAARARRADLYQVLLA